MTCWCFSSRMNPNTNLNMSMAINILLAIIVSMLQWFYILFSTVYEYVSPRRKDISNNVVMITEAGEYLNHFGKLIGSGSVTGKALAHHFAAQGCTLVLLDSNKQNVEEVAHHVRELVTIICDLYHIDCQYRAAKLILSRWILPIEEPFMPLLLPFTRISDQWQSWWITLQLEIWLEIEPWRLRTIISSEHSGWISCPTSIYWNRSFQKCWKRTKDILWPSRMQQVLQMQFEMFLTSSSSVWIFGPGCEPSWFGGGGWQSSLAIHQREEEGHQDNHRGDLLPNSEEEVRGGEQILLS